MKETHILVMEDDATISAALDMILTEAGYDVDVAETGEAALELFGQKRFDLIIADLKLPGINGMEVIKQIKEKTPEMEVIVITGVGTQPIAEEALELGAHDFLPKPFTDDQIKTAINEALKQHDAGPFRLFSLIQKREVLGVLSRAADDQKFWEDLMELGSEALEKSQLIGDAKAAIASGDLKWINENVGELNQKQLKFIYKRLERETY
ncbi:MAG: response regulator [Deltaproteobacteria bacterium]|nr:response regulator [Deltaproteobacteria bacterium]MBW2343983.1 response regulator [Deltaproteobacteria bacterium]